MTIPFVQNNCVVFECRSGKLCVGDLVNEPCTYNVPSPGICHLPGSGIVATSTGSRGSFSVDNAQMFLIDAEHYNAVKSAVLAQGIVHPNHELYEELRGRHRTAFGYVSAGDLYDSDFAGDGNYRIEESKIRAGLPMVSTEGAAGIPERLRRIISKMNTLVCAKCFSMEISSHPALGVAPMGRKEKEEWAIEMAKYAMAQGWIATGDKGDFGDVTPVCPACQLKGKKG